MTKQQAWINLSTRIKPELKEKIDRYRQSTNEPIREIVEKALTRFLCNTK